MFCDLVGSTALSGELDPEELNEVTRGYHSVCAEIIEHHAGRIAQFMGDGLLVYFGYPFAHEDNAQRAVRAALEILTSVSDRKRVRMPLQVRIAIHTGLAVVGELGGDTNPDPMAISGETPNIAARLQSIAEPGQLVVSAATHRLIEGFFVCRSLGTPPLKGVIAPVEAFEVTAPTGIHTRFDRAVASGLTPFVSREPELAELLACWRRARSGRGQVAMVSGEAGIGKSRLVQELTARTGDESRWELRCQCSPYYQNSAFYPAIEFLQQTLGFNRGDDAHVRLAKLERALAAFDLNLSEMMPLFAALLSLPPSEQYPALAISPQRQKQKTVEAIVEWLMRCAEHGSTRLVVEDLHWADPSTLELVEILMERLSSAPLLLILVFRPEFKPPWRSSPRATNITLRRLAGPEAALMIEFVAGGKRLPGELTSEIVAKTEGVPLFVEALTQMVLESGLVQERGERFVLTGAVPSLAIPSTLYDSLMARLDRLGTAKEVAQLAATIGKEFSYELLLAISPLEETRLTGALNRLVDAELVTQNISASQTSYSFRHALIRDAAYESLLRSKRREYHALIARILQEKFPELVESHPELLASHYTEADLVETAIPLWQKAGQMALERSANQEAIHHLTNGLELLGRLPGTTEHRNQELLLRVTLGPALMAAKGFASIEAQDVYSRARALCKEFTDGPLPFQVSWALWVSHACRAEHKEALEVAYECYRLAKLSRDSDQLVCAHHATGAELLCVGRFAESLDHFKQGAVVYDSRHHANIVGLCGQDSGAVCLAYQGFALWFLGFPDQARHRLEQGLALAHKLSHPLTRVTIANIACWAYPLLRDPAATLREAELAIALSDEHQFEYWRAMAVMAQGWALSQQGRLDDAIIRLQEGLISYRSFGAVVITAYYMTTLADMLRKAGRIEEGLGWLPEAQAILEKTGETWCESELFRVKGELIIEHFGAEPHTDAEEDLQRAVLIARQQGAKSLELRAAMSLSRLLLKQGRKTEAHQAVSGVYGWFAEGFDTPDLREAKVLVEQLSC